jgi:hypothetical protein
MNDLSNNEAFRILSEVRVIVGKLEVQIEGNGGKGVLKRQDEIETRQDVVEKWIGKRPVVCPATAKEVMKSIAKAVSIATAVLGLIVGLAFLMNLKLGGSNLEKLQEQMQSLQDAVEKLTE